MAGPVSAQITVDMSECDELVRRLRWCLASILREQAEAEDPRVAARLREIADAFEGAEEMR